MFHQRLNRQCGLTQHAAGGADDNRALGGLCSRWAPSPLDFQSSFNPVRG